MATEYRGVITSQPTSLGGSIPGDAATGHLLRDIAEWTDNLFPEETEILAETPRGAPRENAQAKLEWGANANLPMYSNLAESGFDASETDLTVTTGTGTRFKKWHKLAVYDLDENGQPDWGLREEMVVSAEPATDVLTVIRGQGNTAGRAFTIGARVEIIGTAMPEGQDFTVGPIVYGDFYSNYYQLFEDMAYVTEEGDTTANAEFKGREMARQVAFKTRRLKRELQKALIHGTAEAGTLATPIPSQMGGFIHFVPSANVTDAVDQPISPYDIETAGAALWNSVGTRGAKRLFMSMRTARYFDGLMNKYRQASMDTTTANLQFTAFETRVGTYQVTPVHEFPEGIILGVNIKDYRLIPWPGMNWKEKEVETAGPYRKRAIYGKFTLQADSPETSFLIKNFDTNLANYGRTF